MNALLEIKGSQTEGARYIVPDAVDFVGEGQGSNSCSIRLRCGTALPCTHMAAAELATKLRVWLGGRLLQLRSGYVNVSAVDAVLPNGATIVAKLRGGSNVGIDPSEIAVLDAAVAKAAGLQAKVAA